MRIRNRTRILVEGALMIALSTVLSYLTIFKFPQGGSISLEMMPLILMGMRNGTVWGCFTGLVHGVMQMFIGFQNVMYCQTIWSQIGCILLDYIVAYAVLGLAKLLAAPFQNKVVGYSISAAVCGLLRFGCSFLSGWILWGDYVPENWQPWIYSLVYNGSYMLPSIVITVFIIAFLTKCSPQLLRRNFI